jgi:phage terminase large subunit-like protein
MAKDKTYVYRSKESHFGKTAAARRAQLANLRHSKIKTTPLSPSHEAKADPFNPIYKHDICKYLEDHFYIVETKAPIVLEPWQKERILLPLFEIDAATGLRKYTLAILGMPKKNGKSTLSAAILNYFLFQDEENGELILAANSKEQSSWVIFEKLCKSLRMNPHQYRHVKITDDYIENTTGTVVRVIAQNYKTASGSNPSLVVFDELWGFEDVESGSDSARKFFDELTTVPTRKQPLTVISSYAGFSEDNLLWELYQKGLAHTDPKFFLFWTNENLASWITPEYLATQKERLRPNAYLRLHENRWTSNEDIFIDIADYDRCVDPERVPLLEDLHREYKLILGVDIGIKNDNAAVVAVAKKENRVILIAHKKWKPSKENPLDIEETVEKYIRELAGKFSIQEIRYDPYQCHRSAMSLAKDGIKMVEFPQSVPNLTEMGQNLYDLLKGGNLQLYKADDLRLHAQNARAQETPRGFRIVKGKSSDKIDLFISLAIAALGAIQSTSGEVEIYVSARSVYGPQAGGPVDITCPDFLR